MNALDIMRLLLEQGANVNQRNTSGNTALMEAASMGALDIMRLLIENGANVNQENTRGNTALMQAVSMGALNIVCLLVEQGANMNEQDKCGRTPLMLSVDPSGSTRKIHMGIVRFLVEQGANMNVRNVYGQNVLQLAERKRRTEAADVLLEAALLLTLHVGEPSPIGLVNATATDINGNELASVEVCVSFQTTAREPTDSAWRTIREAMSQELRETRLLCFMLPDGRILR